MPLRTSKDEEELDLFLGLFGLVPNSEVDPAAPDQEPPSEEADDERPR